MIGRSYPLPYPLVRLSSIVDRKLSRELLFFLKLNINFALKENLKEASFYIIEWRIFFTSVERNLTKESRRTESLIEIAFVPKWNVTRFSKISISLPLFYFHGFSGTEILFPDPWEEIGKQRSIIWTRFFSSTLCVFSTFRLLLLIAKAIDRKWRRKKMDDARGLLISLRLKGEEGGIGVG